MRKLIVVVCLAAGLISINPASATHATEKGVIVLAGAPQTFCTQPTPPGMQTHGVYSISEACYPIPAGVTGMNLSYAPVHPDAWLSCIKMGDKVQIYGTKVGGPFLDWDQSPPIIVFAPTVAQTFTITWLHGPTDWSACGL